MTTENLTQDRSRQSFKVPPHSIPSEHGVLGGLLLNNRAWDTVSATLSSNDFYRQDHRVLFEAMTEVFASRSPCDVITLAEHLDRCGKLNEVGGHDYIGGLAENTPSSANIIAYARLVREYSLLRQLMDIGYDMAGAALSPQGKSSTEILDMAMSAMMQLTQHHDNYEYSAAQMINNALATVDSDEKGVPSGLKELDGRIGGFRAGDLYVLGARPAMGKTALLLNFALACQVPCGIISSEQGHQQVGLRLIAMKGRVSAHKLRLATLDEEGWSKATKAATDIGQMQAWVNDQPGPTINQVVRQARKWKQQHGIQILYLDYIQRLKTESRAERHEQINEICQGLKELARELNIPVVALAQVNREVEKRNNKRPLMSDFKDGGAIEQEADDILTLYRDEVYDSHTPKKGIAEVSVLKNRHGPTGYIECTWLKDFMLFENLEKRGDIG